MAVDCLSQSKAHDLIIAGILHWKVEGYRSDHFENWPVQNICSYFSTPYQYQLLCHAIISTFGCSKLIGDCTQLPDLGRVDVAVDVDETRGPLGLVENLAGEPEVVELAVRAG